MRLRELAYQRKLAEEGIDPYAATAGTVVGAVPASAAVFNRSNIKAPTMTAAELASQARPGDVFVTRTPLNGVSMKTFGDLASAIPQYRENPEEFKRLLKRVFTHQDASLMLENPRLLDAYNSIKNQGFRTLADPNAMHAGMIGQEVIEGRAPSQRKIDRAKKKGLPIPEKKPDTIRKNIFHHSGAGKAKEKGLEPYLKQIMADGDDIVLMRPKDKSMAGTLQQAAQNRASKDYNIFAPVKAGLIDLFTPAPIQKAIGAATEAGGAQCNPANNFCSTLVSGSAGNSFGAVNKNQVMPQHLLRSNELEQIGTTAKQQGWKDRLKNMSKSKLLLRGGAGLGLGYGTYKGVKALRDYFGDNE